MKRRRKKRHSYTTNQDVIVRHWYFTIVVILQFYLPILPGHFGFGRCRHCRWCRSLRTLGMMVSRTFHVLFTNKKTISLKDTERQIVLF